MVLKCGICDSWIRYIRYIYNLFIFHSKTVTVGWSLSRSFWGAVATSQMDGCDHLDDVHFALENVSSPLTPPVTAQPCTAQPCTAQPSPALRCPALPALQSAQSRSFGWWLMRLVEPWNWRSDGSMRTSHLLLVSLFKNGVTSCLKEYLYLI